MELFRNNLEWLVCVSGVPCMLMGVTHLTLLFSTQTLQAKVLFTTFVPILASKKCNWQFSTQKNLSLHTLDNFCDLFEQSMLN